MNSRSLSHSNLSVRAGLLALGFALTLGALQLRAQGDLQAQVAELKESAAKNKEALAQYSWQETVKIILKGEEKKTEHFEVRQGPDGNPSKLRSTLRLPRSRATAAADSSSASLPRKKRNTRSTPTA